MITIIGDVHCQYEKYKNIIKNLKSSSIQIGDFGFEYDCLKEIDPKKHKIVAGNHDNYDIIVNYPHYLGDFGNYNLEGIDFFFYRGAHSIDKDQRTPRVNWWPQEQNSEKVFEEAKELYIQTKPEIVITHCCPYSVIPNFFNLNNSDKEFNSETDQALEKLWRVHKPKLWIFGHFHTNKNIKIKGTNFICVDELSTFEVK